MIARGFAAGIVVGCLTISSPLAAETAMPFAQVADAAAETEIAYWNSVKDSLDPAEYRAYLAQYPNGRFASLAKLRLERLETAIQNIKKAAEEKKARDEQARQREQARLREERKREEAKPRSLNDVLENMERDRPVPKATVDNQGKLVLPVHELDKVRSALSRLWHVPAGVQGVEKMSVDIAVTFDPTLKITGAEIVGGNGSQTDAGYKAFVESALRAVNRLERLPLPGSDYSKGGTTVVPLSPADMF